MMYIVSALISLCISLGALFVPQPEKPLSPQMQAAIQAYVSESMQGPIVGTTQPIAGTTYLLAGSGVSQTGTSITLSSFTLPQNGYKIPDSALSDTFYITLEPGSPTKQEIVSCTIDTQNANGTATFTGCTRGLSPIPDYTASTSLRFSHGGGTQVIFSNPPQFYADFAQLQNSNTFSGAVTFTNSPTLTNACTVGSANSAICSKAYVDSVAVAGASNANETTKGIGELATGVEAASSTSLGSTAARLLLPASLASSSPWSTSTSTLVMTRLDGKINPLFIATSSGETYNWGALMNFIGATTFTNAASTTVAKGFYANSIAAAYFNATSTNAITGATSTFIGVIITNASTTNFEVGGVCTNCATNGYEQDTNTGAGPTVANNGATVGVSCTTPKRVMSCMGSDNVAGHVFLRDASPSSGTACSITFVADSVGASANTMTATAICVNP